jgi:hypothetical protein
MITKTIFLDFDGVLNSHLFYAKGRPTKIEDHIDESAVSRLNSLIQSTDAKIVVTSVWRNSRTVKELQELLTRNGFVGEVVGKTKNLQIGEDGDCILRGNEILCWMKNNKDLIGADYWEYHNYVILDDDSDMLYWQRNNFIHVDPWCGLTPNTIFRAEKLLNS